VVEVTDADVDASRVSELACWRELSYRGSDTIVGADGIGLETDRAAAEDVESAGAIGADAAAVETVAEISEVGDGRINDEFLRGVVVAEGKGDAGVFQAELDGDIDALAVDGLEGDGTVLTEDAGRGGEEEVAGGIEAGRDGEAEGDAGGVSAGGAWKSYSN